jgi:hypothetical protein
MQALTDSMSFLWNASNANIQDEALQYFQEQELKCDPVYLAITFGKVYLCYQKLLQKHKEECAKLSREGKPLRPLQGIKISFKEDSSIKVKEPGPTQGLSRRLLGEGREELGELRPHLIKLLRWFGYDSSISQTLLKVCKSGIEVILEGYQYPQNQKITISQTATQPLSRNFETHPSTAINIRVGALEKNFIVRILKDDVKLLEKALGEKNDRQKAEFARELEEEETRYFPLHRLKLSIKSGKTIDTYMLEKVKEKWNHAALKAIVGLFNAESTPVINQNASLDLYASLDLLIRHHPSSHQELKNEIRELFRITLSQCNLEVENVEENSEEDS